MPIREEAQPSRGSYILRGADASSTAFLAAASAVPGAAAALLRPEAAAALLPAVVSPKAKVAPVGGMVAPSLPVVRDPVFFFSRGNALLRKKQRNKEITKAVKKTVNCRKKL